MPSVTQIAAPVLPAPKTEKRRWVMAKFRLNMVLFNLLKGEHIDGFDFVEPEGAESFKEIVLWVRPCSPAGRPILGYELSALIREGFVTSSVAVEKGDKLEISLDLKPLEASAEVS